jgi:Protein of unknown function (DUF3631)
MTSEEMVEQAKKTFYARKEAEFIRHPKTSSGEFAANSVAKLYARFISYPSPHCLTAHVLWTFHTHIVDRFDTTPRLAFLSPEPASGKTRALELTERLLPNPVSAINVTPAYLFRKIGDELGATILFDEIDTVFGPKAKENEELRGLLNAGYRRGAVAGRCVVHGKTVETEEIPAFAPVALAGLGWLPDTIMSRAVIIRMQRRAAGEVVEPYRRRIHDSVTEDARRLIEKWASTFPKEIDSWPELPAGIEDRNADVWEPLIAIADMFGADWSKRAREAAVALVAASKEREPSLGVRLLTDLRTVFGDSEHMPTAAILQALHEIEEAPWGNMKGQPLNSRGLSQRLLQYGIKPKTIRVGTGTPKGYARADLHEAWLRYLPSQSPDRSATGATRPINVNENMDIDVADNVADLLTVADRAATPNLAATKERQQNQPVISDVADVADFPGYGGACAHCGGVGGTVEVSVGGEMAWLHYGCIKEWEARR